MNRETANNARYRRPRLDAAADAAASKVSACWWSHCRVSASFQLSIHHSRAHRTAVQYTAAYERLLLLLADCETRNATSAGTRTGEQTNKQPFSKPTRYDPQPVKSCRAIDDERHHHLEHTTPAHNIYPLAISRLDHLALRAAVTAARPLA